MVKVEWSMTKVEQCHVGLYDIVGLHDIGKDIRVCKTSE